MVSLKTQFVKNIAYGFAAFLVLTFAFWIMYTNFQAQLEIRANAMQRAEDSFKGASKNLTSFLLERQDDIRGLALDRTITTYFENKALGMSMKYGLLVSLNNIRRQLNAFQQQYKIEGKTIFPRLLLQDNQGNKLAGKRTHEFDNIPDKNRIYKAAFPLDHFHISHDNNHPNFIVISAPCIFKKKLSAT